jgi:hypothetical protein
MMDFCRRAVALHARAQEIRLLPIFLMMVVFGGLVVLTKGTVFAPFIYTLF